MDQSKSLHKLLEVADLIAMVEDLAEPDRVQNMSAASWAGMRITLRNSREILLDSHESLSRNLVQSARQGDSRQSPRTLSNGHSIDRTRIRSTEDANGSEAAVANANGGQPPQRDLKSALERFVDRQ